MRDSTRRIARLSLLSAFGTVITFLGHVIPTGQLGLIAIASFSVCVALMMYGCRWALGVYAIISALSLLLFPGAASIGFAAAFGYYPIVKSLLERLHNRTVSWVLKYVLYTAVFAAYWALARALFLGNLASFPWYLLYILGGVVFGIYDWGYSLLIRFYIARIARYFP